LDLNLQPVRAKGSRIEMKDGETYLDFVCGYGAAPLGHSPVELVEALTSELGSDSVNVFPLGCSPYVAALAEHLVELSEHRFGKVHFSSTGSEAVDSAVKFALIHTGKKQVISIAGGFHGLSMMSTWLAGNSYWAEGIPWNPPNCIHVERTDMALIEQHVSAGSVAALILEPIQGSADANGWSREGLLELREICTEHGTLIIFDEVLSGLGRTGNWFGSQTLGVQKVPDIMLVSKGMTGGLIPVSAVLMTDSIYESVFGRVGKAKVHGSTFGGNTLAMRCALRTLQLIAASDLLANARDKGRKLIAGINAANGKSGLHCAGTGLLLSISVHGELEEQYGAHAATILWRDLLSRRVITIPAAHDASCLRIIPPLNVSDEDVGEFIDAVNGTVKELVGG
jgi:acetylornithine/succinyldiaminopimelate/putrescine aminotransferase